jgi:ribosomal protein S18 acetylase RimI-like enzyme
MLIRSADDDDLDGLTFTHDAAWHECYANILPRDVLMSVTMDGRRSGWVAALADPNRQNVVCVIDGQIVGFASFGSARDADATPDTAELIGLYVHPRRWRQGIGRALWEAVAERVEARYWSTTLWVLRDNTRARRFYESVGFGPAIERERASSRLGGAIEVRYRRLTRPQLDLFSGHATLQ